jgi:hypothetical protein
MLACFLKHTNSEHLSVTHFRDPTVESFTLKMITESHLFSWKIIYQKEACDKKIFAYCHCIP